MSASGAAAAAGLARRPATSADGRRTFLLVAVALLLFFLVPLAAHAWRYPVGADVPYYVWSTRLAGDAGLSVTDFRPGLHAVLLLLSGSTGLSTLQLAGALAVAVAVSTGLAGAVLADRGLGRDPLRSAAVGISVGAYIARLASGFLANLLFAALFVGAVTLLVRGRRREAALSAAVLGAAGLSHGLFLLVGAAVLGGAGVLRLLARGDGPRVRDDLARLGVAAGGGGAVAIVGFLLAALGRPLSAEERVHSRDALLQRADLSGRVGDAYRARWLEALRAFRPEVSVPLGGLGAAGTWLERRRVDALFVCLLAAWAAVIVAGVVVGLVTSWIPAGRVLNFALVLAVLGALGAVAVGRWVAARRRALGIALGAVLLLALLGGPLRAWSGTHPFVSKPDLAAAAAAGGVIDDLPARTPVLFVIDHRGPHAGFELGRFINVIRMGVPVDRGSDVHFLVGGPDDYLAGRPGANGDPEHDGIARDAFARARPVLTEPHAALLLRPFNQEGWDPTVGRSRGSLVRVLRAPDPEAFPVSRVAPENTGLHPAFLPLVALGVLLLLALLGAGWVARFGPGLGPEGWSLAPVVGAAALVLLGVAFDAAGLRLESWGGVATAAGLAASGLAWRSARVAAP